MSVSSNVTELNVVMDALMRTFVGMSPTILPYRDELVPHSKPTADSGKLVIFVGYTQEENASIIKTWSEYLVKGECSVYVVSSKATPSDSIFLSNDYIEELVETLSSDHEMDYIMSHEEMDGLDNVVSTVELNFFDYLIIENASIVKNATVPDMLKSLRKVTSDYKGNAVISMTPDEFALIANKVDLFDVVIRK